uniref:FAM3 metabolism regulating signaling molecule D n=1 Tax=Denticeps clupeoides TaxID=299321 RepID=A0AAY4CI05_9TELE
MTAVIGFEIVGYLPRLIALISRPLLYRCAHTVPSLLEHLLHISLHAGEGQRQSGGFRLWSPFFILHFRVYQSPVDRMKVNAKCCLPQKCPSGHFAFRIRSGAANIVGPKICFEDQIIMSGTKTNVGQGVNIVLLHGETGRTLSSGYFKGETVYLLAFLKTIQPGNLLLVASFDDATEKQVNGASNIFAELGSTFIKSLRYRDNWVFAGPAGIKHSRPFEKNTNVFKTWPRVVEVGGCLPRYGGMQSIEFLWERYFSTTFE